VGRDRRRADFRKLQERQALISFRKQTSRRSRRVTGDFDVAFGVFEDEIIKRKCVDWSGLGNYEG
jgi:hypothetical protein